MSYSYGWKPENEHLHDLSDITHSVACSVDPGEKVPDNLDLPWMQDDQLGWPFCHAHMRSGAEEILAGLQMDNGKFPSYSRYFAAITDMREDGDDRSPEGASISGSIRAAIRWGDPNEDLFPYPPYDPRRYSNQIPASVVAAAKAHKLKSVSPRVQSYDQMIGMAKSQRYVFLIGLFWTEGMAALRGVETSQGTSPFSGGVLGGHAVLSFGWKKVGGDLWPILHNSHNGWGVRRRVALSPKFWDRVLQDPTFGVWGASDIELTDFTPVPREYSFKEKGVAV